MRPMPHWITNGIRRMPHAMTNIARFFGLWF
ncbi:hypothetical protein J2X03_003773 [Microbacterium trichothecenolyticum]|nr:hypothetical protein [Microbacterium trichothecenolyticum]